MLDRPLHIRTFLSPSIPVSLFEALAGHIGRSLGCEVVLSFDETRSGPRPGEPEPFSTAEVDVAFVCATSWVWLTAVPDPPIRLVGAAWVPIDPRSEDQPVYFGDVVVGPGGPTRLTDLPGRRIAYNDAVSLSGYHSLRLALVQQGIDVHAVDFVRSGSHLRSLELLQRGEVAAAAIDSTVWHRVCREQPALDLTAIAALGPHPVQPAVARTDLPAAVRAAVRVALLSAHRDADVAAALSHARLRRFVPTDDTRYRTLADELARSA